MEVKLYEFIPYFDQRVLVNATTGEEVGWIFGKRGFYKWVGVSTVMSQFWND